MMGMGRSVNQAIEGPLTTEIRNKHSPVRQFFDERFGNTRPMQQEFRAHAGPLIIRGSDANPGTIGTAADWLCRFMLNPQPDVSLALWGAALSNRPRLSLAAADLAGLLGARVPAGPRLGVVSGGAKFSGPTAGSCIDRELLLRGSWALALLTEAYRAGQTVLLKGPLAALLTADDLTSAHLLDLAPTAALDQLTKIHDVFAATLLPALHPRSGEWVLGPTFSGSRLMNADADLIVAGLLLDIKTSLGDKDSNGENHATLVKETLYQLIGYALLDFSDEYRIAEIGVFTARFAYLWRSPLDRVLNEAAGMSVDLAESRRDFEAMLRKALPRLP